MAARLRSGMPLPEGVRPERIEPLWSRVDRNRAKIAFFISAYLLSIALSAGLIAGLITSVVLAFSLRGPWMNGDDVVLVADVALGAALSAFALGSVWVAYATLASERRLLRHLGAVLTPTGEYMPTKLALKDMAIASGFGHAPPLWVIPECTRINAFAVGRTRRGAVIGVTQGFVDRLGEADQRAVFANLMARLCNGDVGVATAVSALVGPIWRLRDADLRRDEETMSDIPDEYGGLGMLNAARRQSMRYSGAVLGFVLYGFVVILSQALLLGHEAAARLTAEKADAEGMLLLKDPHEMLRALVKVLDANNTVPSAGEAYSDLFYCWAGFGYAPEDDPEYRRVFRLREVLGIEGLTDSSASPVATETVLAPAPPRLTERTDRGR